MLRYVENSRILQMLSNYFTDRLQLGGYESIEPATVETISSALKASHSGRTNSSTHDMFGEGLFTNGSRGMFIDDI